MSGIPKAVEKAGSELFLAGGHDKVGRSLL
jgi:hypothetical protein